MAFSKEFVVGPQQVAAFADLVQDHNPIHLSAQFAQGTRYKAPICHGLLLTAYISGCLVEVYGQGTVYLEQQVQFRRPVPVGSKIRVVLGEGEAQEKGALKLSTTIEVQVGSYWKKAIEGYAVINPGY